MQDLRPLVMHQGVLLTHNMLRTTWRRHPLSGMESSGNECALPLSTSRDLKVSRLFQMECLASGSSAVAALWSHGRPQAVGQRPALCRGSFWEKRALREGAGRPAPLVRAAAAGAWQPDPTLPSGSSGQVRDSAKPKARPDSAAVAQR